MAALPKEYWKPPIWDTSHPLSPVQVPIRYDYYEPLPGSEWIRILIIEPAPRFEDPLECSIQVVPLEPSSNYAALSYSWGMNADGDKSLSRVIDVSGQHMHITQNLYEGLRRIRPRGEAWDAPKRVWIDGICINQADDVERGAQVAVMALIYQFSTETILWLGEGENENDDVMVLRLLEQLEACPGMDLSTMFKAIIHTRTCLWRLHRSDCVCFCSDPKLDWSLGLVNGRRNGEFDGQALPDAIKEIIDNGHPELLDVIEDTGAVLAAFLRRRYWNRRWIVQELFYSRSKQLYWGPCRLDLSQRRLDESLDKIRAIMKNISWMTQGGVRETIDDSCPFQRLSEMADAVRELFRMSYPDSTSLLVHALGRFSDMECQDPRDRLYSFISLDQSLNIVPSYQLTIAEVYLQFAQALIDRGMFMDIFYNLRQHHAIPDSAQLDLPSWVPDLRLTFTSIPKRMVKIPKELWAHRDGSLSCSLYYIGTVVSAGIYTKLSFQVTVRPSSVRGDSTVDSHGNPKQPVTKRYLARVDSLIVGTPKTFMINPGDFLFSPIPLEFPPEQYESTKVMFLRHEGSYGDVMACRVIGAMAAHGFEREDQHDADVLECREMVLRLI